jgi:hypothetical protein
MKYQIPIHYREDAYLNEFIRQKFDTALLNNKKWVKLIAALVANAAEIKECLVKPIWDDAEPTRQLCFDENTYYNFDYYGFGQATRLVCL